MSEINKIIRGNAANVFSSPISNDNLYEILDKTEGGLTNAQMEFALQNIGFVKLGSVYQCTDSGTYTEKHFYKFTTGGWEDTTQSLEGKIDKLSSSDVGKVPVIDQYGNLYASNKKLSEMASQSYVDSAIASAITTALNTPV